MSIYIVCVKDKSKSRKAIEVCKSCKDRIYCDSYNTYIAGNARHDQEEKEIDMNTA